MTARAPRLGRETMMKTDAGFSRWVSQGACRDADPEIFFPNAAQGPALAQVSSAKAVCRRCAVNTACLSFSLETRQEGIWGGTTGEERLAMRPRPADPAAHADRPDPAGDGTGR
jgi:WhiB family transcriptional regulator, redox-sensing transcriptional regulator